jgi:hypothetical protein
MQAQQEPQTRTRHSSRPVNGDGHPASVLVNAVIHHSYDDIRTVNRPIPSILETEMLVRVHGCGLCGSDILKIVERRYIFKMQENEHGKYTL